MHLVMPGRSRCETFPGSEQSKHGKQTFMSIHPVTRQSLFAVDPDFPFILNAKITEVYVEVNPVWAKGDPALDALN